MADPARNASGAEQQDILAVQAGRGDGLAGAGAPAVGSGEVSRRVLAAVPAALHSAQLARARGLRRQAAVLRESSMAARASRQAARDHPAAVDERVQGARDRFWTLVRSQTGRAATSDGQEPANRQFEVRHDAVQTLYGVGLSLQAMLPLTRQQDLRGPLEQAISDIDAVIAGLRSQLGQLGPASRIQDPRASGLGRDPS